MVLSLSTNQNPSSKKLKDTQPVNTQATYTHTPSGEMTQHEGSA